MKYSLFIPLSMAFIFSACDTINTAESTDNSSKSDTPNYFKGNLTDTSDSSSIKNSDGGSTNNSDGNSTNIFDRGSTNNSDGNSTSNHYGNPTWTNDLNMAFVPEGELAYERHSDSPDGLASFKCNVYSTDHSISMNMRISLLNGTSWLEERLYRELNSPASYSGVIGAGGLFKTSLAYQCTEVKSSFDKVPNGSVACSDSSISFTSDIPSEELSDKEYYMSFSKLQTYAMCDDFYKDFQEDFGDPVASSPAPDAEKALSCDVSQQGSKVTTTVIYSDKTAIFTISNMDGYANISESYIGIDEATLAKVCDAYKTEVGIRDVNCSNSLITYNSTDVFGDDELNAYVNFMKMMECPYLLDGTMTLEDIWFGD